MTPNTFSVHFILKKDKIDKKGRMPIYAKITINNQRVELSINRKINPDQWISSEEIAKPNSEEQKIINNQIEAFKSRVYLAYSSILSSNQVLNADNFKAAFYGENKKKSVPTLSVENQQWFWQDY